MIMVMSIIATLVLFLKVLANRSSVVSVTNQQWLETMQTLNDKHNAIADLFYGKK